MRILLALGGSALLRRGESVSAPTQRRNIESAAYALARIASEHEVIITHGSGLQVGLLALQNEAFPDVPPYPLEVLDAESEGMVGHMLELALRNELPERDVVSILTEVIVAADDPAFQRLVPSPEPHAIAEIRSLRILLDSGALVICAGRGGTPVALDSLGTLRRVEALIDEDLTAALLARRLDADLLVMLIDIDAVHSDWHGPHDRSIAGAAVAELRAMSFDSGSMAPKVEAACRFTEATGRRAAIGSLRDVARVVQGEAGTQVHPAAAEPAISATRRLPRR